MSAQDALVLAGSSLFSPQLPMPGPPVLADVPAQKGSCCQVLKSTYRLFQGTVRLSGALFPKFSCLSTRNILRAEPIALRRIQEPLTPTLTHLSEQRTLFPRVLTVTGPGGRGKSLKAAAQRPHARPFLPS